MNNTIVDFVSKYSMRSTQLPVMFTEKIVPDPYLLGRFLVVYTPVWIP